MKADNINWNEYFLVDFERGTLTWKNRPLEHFANQRAWKIWNTRFSGKKAGGPNGQGYLEVRVESKSRPVHRIIFEMANGPISLELDVDHRDQHKSNNALSNLRKATRSQNQQNQGPRSDNTSGYKGVSWHKSTGKWTAAIKVAGRKIHLGLFHVSEDAGAAYSAAAKIYHGEYASAN